MPAELFPVVTGQRLGLGFKGLERANDRLSHQVSRLLWDLGDDCIPALALNYRDDCLLVVGANDGVTFPMTDLLTTPQCAPGARTRACGWGFAPGGRTHWRRVFSFASGTAGCSTGCRPWSCLRTHAGKASHDSPAACWRPVLGSIAAATESRHCGAARG